MISSWCWTRPAFKTWNRFYKKYVNELFDLKRTKFDKLTGRSDDFIRKLGCELSEDEKFTKPKHRIIADAYAKRLEDVISVSIQNSHTDPAGLNFDMNNLNSTESNGMGTTLTNYLCNIINRRNAVTSMDFGEANANCNNRSSYDSELSLSIRHFEYVESRRSSVDSQVSVKLSEIDYKAKIETHSQKHKSVNMKAKKRQRNYYARRTNRRASTSSVESQRMTTHLKNHKQKYPNNRIQLSALRDKTESNRQNERRSACTTFDARDIHELINRNRNKLDPISLTTDDDQSNNESQQIHDEHTPTNMIVPYGGRQTNDSGDCLEISNEKHNQTLEQMLYPIVKNYLRNSQSSYDRNDFRMNGAPKNSRKSMKSNKSLRSSRSKTQTQQYQHHQQHQQTTTKFHDQTTVSMTSSLALDVPFDGTKSQSSFSDQSAGRIKTQSQNSKGSCDVGIQANAYDIASYHSRQRSHDDAEKDNVPEKLQPNQNYHNDEDEFTETHQLLPFKRREAISIVSRKDDFDKMSDSERLRHLLLP